MPYLMFMIDLLSAIKSSNRVKSSMVKNLGIGNS